MRDDQVKKITNGIGRDSKRLKGSVFVRKLENTLKILMKKMVKFIHRVYNN